MKKLWLLLCLLTLQISAQQVLSVKEQAQVVDEILAERFNTVLP